MPHITPEVIGAKLLLRGIHLNLTDAMKAVIHEKVGRLLRHEPRIDRIRIDVDLDKTKGSKPHFIAKGQIEIGGPDLIASVDSDDAYKSVDLLMDKLDGLLRKRHSALKEKRHHPHAVELDAALPKTV
ncbi:MAG: ribosome-associated translation inhibitor RaiA [Verrucomicrobia bacterium]|nr:ribosome-associated translation inhibitor RaiA [Verrucomicrobiota bacterium]